MPKLFSRALRGVYSRAAGGGGTAGPGCYCQCWKKAEGVGCNPAGFGFGCLTSWIYTRFQLRFASVGCLIRIFNFFSMYWGLLVSFERIFATTVSWRTLLRVCLSTERMGVRNWSPPIRPSPYLGFPSPIGPRRNFLFTQQNFPQYRLNILWLR